MINLISNTKQKTKKSNILSVIFIFINFTVQLCAANYDVANELELYQAMSPKITQGDNNSGDNNAGDNNFAIQNLDFAFNKSCDCYGSVYERPHSFSANCPQQKGLFRNTGLFVGGAIGVMGILYLLPESTTKWDKNSFTFENVFGKWLDNVAAGPVLDNDTWFMNYVAHPYWGGVFHMAARSLGHSAITSFLYSAALSTFLWEYGFEALAEIPSTQDLIITPLTGFVVGELFYIAKRGIVKNDYRLFNSKFLGHLATFVMDPTNEFSNLVFSERNDNGMNNLTVNFNLQPNFVLGGKLGYNVSFFYRF